IADTSDRFFVHPSLLDAALQASIGLLHAEGRFGAIVPFASDKIEIYRQLPSSAWAIVSRSDVANDTLLKVDLDICDDDGAIAVSFTGFCFRIVDATTIQREKEKTSLLLAGRTWIESNTNITPQPPSYQQHSVLVSGLDIKLPDVDLVCWKPEAGTLPQQYQAFTLQVLDRLQRLLSSSPRSEVLLQVVLVPGIHQDFFARVAGMLTTAKLENPKVIGQVIELDFTPSTNQLTTILKQNAALPEDTWIKYKNGSRLTPKWQELESNSSNYVMKNIWRDRGVYLITGGAGGLGVLFAAEIAAKARKATVVLVGRSAVNPEIKQKIEALEKLGIDTIYKKVDIADATAVEELITSIIDDYGTLNAVIHAAGVTRDNFILNKKPKDLTEVFAAKVIGAENLDRFTKSLRLDLFLLCSSITSELGNPAQSDYAAANGFMDSFAYWRNQLVLDGERFGRTLSINWPLWRDGGMNLAPHAAKALYERFGMLPMSTDNAMSALYKALQSSQSQLLVMEGVSETMQDKLLTSTKISTTTPTEMVNETEQSNMKDNVIEAVARILDIEASELDLETTFDELGLDIQGLNQVFARLNEKFKLENVYGEFCKQTTLRGLIDVVEKVSSKVLPKAEVTSSVNLHNEKRNESAEVLAQQLVKTVLSKATNISIDRIEINADFNAYGLDSLMIIQMTDSLEKTFGSLSKTLFFEYRNVRQLAAHLAAIGGDRLIAQQNSKTHNAAANPSSASSSFAVSNAQKSISKNTATTNGVQKLQNVKPSRFVSASKKDKKGAKEKEVEKFEGKSKDIAVIGVAGRYAGAKNKEEMWKNLREGKDSVGEIPKERWEHEKWYGKVEEGKTYAKWGGFIEGVEEFDPLFFNISPREAEITEPQERLFLECAYEAMQDGGYTAESLSKRKEGKVGVYVGVMYEEYQLYAAQEMEKGRGVVVSSSPSSIANRVSYYCNFRGPSMAVDTMCSSSLTAIHLGCQSILRGESEVVIAGGVNVSIHPAKYLMLGQGRFASSEGKCRSFGEGGDGYVPGEGVGAVLLKKLEEAEADGDHIYAVIKGSAINHGGKTNGYTVPNPQAQAKVIEEAMEEAGVEAESISYVEAHGTGTALGDPIEIAGLSKGFGVRRRQYCAIGSVKSNIGHCESAAGVAGLTKVLLQLKHKELVPSLHSEVINKNIDLDKTPFYVQRELSKWERPEIEGRVYARTASVSSFGAGGSNAHIIVQEYEAREQSLETADSKVVIVLSAKKQKQLKESAARLLRAIDDQLYSEADLQRIAFTLQVGRDHMDFRLAFIADSLLSLSSSLNKFIQEKEDGTYFTNSLTGKDIEIGAGLSDVRIDNLDTLLLNRKLDQLAALWVNGAVIDWASLYGENRPRRISLPTYPFDRKRFWLPKHKGSDSKATDIVEKSEVVRQQVQILEEATLTKPSSSKIKLLSPAEAAQKLKLHQPSLQQTKVRLDSFDSFPTTNLAVQSGQPEVANSDKQETKTENIQEKLKVVKPLSKMEKEIDSWLKKSLSDALYLEAEEVGSRQKFLDLGMDSVVGLEWIREINKHFGTSLSADSIYKYPDVEQLAAHLITHLSSKDVANSDLLTEFSEKTKNKKETVEQEATSKQQMENLQKVLTSTLAEALYMEITDVTLNKPFVDFGLDSVIAVEWIHAIKKKLGVDVAASSLYEYSTIEKLATYIAENFGVKEKGVAKEDLPSTEIPNNENISSIDSLIKQVQSYQLSPSEAAALLDKMSMTQTRS
ncbi:MAG: SDR family NAD(P)-dependent oxidoreductase, partial [Blastocatellia bacterium]|nr:SDR family NAD(P)-dependent oxidoreductase [Blastocatellia bacterium]